MTLVPGARLILCTALALLLASGPVRAQEAGPEGDTVVVAVLANWPPYYGLGPDGQPTGFAVESFRAVAREAGLVPVYRVYESFPETMDAVRRGEADVVPNQGVLEGRPFLFTSTTDAFPVGFFVRASTPGEPAPDQVPGPVAVVESNVGVELAEALESAVTTRVYPTVREALFGLLAGDVDGLIYPSPVIWALARQAKLEDHLRESGPELVEVKRAIAVASSRPDLHRRLDEAVGRFVGSPEYEALYATWFAPPPPFWSVQRVAELALGALLLLSLAFMVLRLRDRQRAAIRLRRSEERYRALFESIRDAIVVADTDRRILAVNRAARELFEYEPDELLGKETEILYAHREDFERLGEGLRSDPKAPDLVMTIRCRTRGGRVFLGETSAFPLEEEDGDVAGFIGVIRDVTDRLDSERRTARLKEELDQARKMEAVGRLAGGVAHDFNNMLTVIQGQAELLLDHAGTPGPLRAPLVEIYDAADRSARLTRQLLAFARQQRIDPRPLDPNETVSGTLTMLQRLIGENIELVWEPCTEAWPVYADPSQMDQVLANLVVNARDALAASGGTIRIETANVTLGGPGPEWAPAEAEGDFVRLSVHDDGAGMSGETLANIYDPFFTTKPTGEGTGLGMATVYGIVQQAGGFIHVDSEVGVGTTVHVLLPRHDGVPESTGAPSDPDAAPGGSERILLVEDDESVLAVTTRLLERMGYEVRGVCSPGLALTEISENGTGFDLLITDLMMPEMNGRELARRVRDRLPELPVLFVSGYSADVLTGEADLHERVHVLAKPYTLPELARRVREVLHI